MVARDGTGTDNSEREARWTLPVGYCVAAVAFALLFLVLSKLLPAFERFVEGGYGKLLLPIAMLFIFMGGFRQHRARVKRRISTGTQK